MSRPLEGAVALVTGEVNRERSSVEAGLARHLEIMRHETTGQLVAFQHRVVFLDPATNVPATAGNVALEAVLQTDRRGEFEEIVENVTAKHGATQSLSQVGRNSPAERLA